MASDDTSDDGAGEVSVPRPVVTLSFIGVNVLVYIAMVAAFGTLSFSAEQGFAAGASYGPAVVGGAYWRLVTANWIHFSLAHILSNMFVLAVWGIPVEYRIGRVRYAIFYLVSGIAGSVASFFVNPEIVSGGASGAIAGVAGMLLVLWLKGDKSISGRNLAINLGLNAMLPFAVGGIDWVAHAGGFVAGAVLLLIFFPRRNAW